MRLICLFALTFLLLTALVLGLSLAFFPLWPALFYAGFFTHAIGLSTLLGLSLLVMGVMLYATIHFHYQRYRQQVSGSWRFLGWDLLWTWLSIQLLWLMLLPIFMAGYARYGMVVLGGGG